jgi:hypothetical protein
MSESQASIQRFPTTAGPAREKERVRPFHTIHKITAECFDSTPAGNQQALQVLEGVAVADEWTLPRQKRRCNRSLPLSFGHRGEFYHLAAETNNPRGRNWATASRRKPLTRWQRRDELQDCT